MKYVLFFLALVFTLQGADYDCVFIGSSPISLFEALYQYGTGKKVLIVDEAPSFGGVWRSIEVCGVPNVDVGCHEIGSNPTLKEFLKIYGGCNMDAVSSSNGFYFSKGCHELTHNLETMISRTLIDVLLNTRAERATLGEECVILEMGEKMVSASKVYMPSYSYINFGTDAPRPIHKSKYYHLYLLIADPTPPRFCYQGHGVTGTSRMMNLTTLVGLENTGRQLIVFQTYSESNLKDQDKFLEDLKKKNWVDPSAYILETESFIYEQWPAGSHSAQGEFKPYFEMLNTHDFRNMTQFFAKWKLVLQPFME